VHFPAGDDRHLDTVYETDAPAEKRDDVLLQAESKCKRVGALQKERTLLWKEQREARQVRTTRVDLRLSKVGVDRERCEDICADALRHVEAWLRLSFDARRG